MTRKTPKEIEYIAYLMAKETTFHSHREKQVFVLGVKRGYTSNQELSDFKKELVEKLQKRFIVYNVAGYSGIAAGFAEIIDLITQEDQPEGGREEEKL
jgi:hypothetical protein